MVGRRKCNPKKECGQSSTGGNQFEAVGAPGKTLPGAGTDRAIRIEYGWVRIQG